MRKRDPSFSLFLSPGFKLQSFGWPSRCINHRTIPTPNTIVIVKRLLYHWAIIPWVDLDLFVNLKSIISNFQFYKCFQVKSHIWLMLQKPLLIWHWIHLIGSGHLNLTQLFYLVIKRPGLSYARHNFEAGLAKNSLSFKRIERENRLSFYCGFEWPHIFGPKASANQTKIYIFLLSYCFVWLIDYSIFSSKGTIIPTS